MKVYYYSAEQQEIINSIARGEGAIRKRKIAPNGELYTQIISDGTPSNFKDAVVVYEEND